MPKLIIIYGTGSHNTEMMARAIQDGARTEGIEVVLENTDLSGKIGLAFGSYGWSFEATQGINEMLASRGVEMMADLCVKRMPGEDDLEKCREAGALLARNLKRKEVLYV